MFYTKRFYAACLNGIKEYLFITSWGIPIPLALAPTVTFFCFKGKRWQVVLSKSHFSRRTGQLFFELGSASRLLYKPKQQFADPLLGIAPWGPCIMTVTDNRYIMQPPTPPTLWYTAFVDDLGASIYRSYGMGWVFGPVHSRVRLMCSARRAIHLYAYAAVKTKIRLCFTWHSDINFFKLCFFRVIPKY